MSVINDTTVKMTAETFAVTTLMVTAAIFTAHVLYGTSVEKIAALVLLLWVPAAGLMYYGLPRLLNVVPTDTEGRIDRVIEIGETEHEVNLIEVDGQDLVAVHDGARPDEEPWAYFTKEDAKNHANAILNEVGQTEGDTA